MDKPALSDTGGDAVATSHRDSLEEDRLDELRMLLLAPEQEQLARLSERLDDPELHAKDVSRVLPDAMRLSAKRGDELTTALAPTVTDIFLVAVKRDLRGFADALFPVIGPAIRRAIAETFKQMLQSLNQTLERSFSWQGLKWRIEAYRTGKPFAEIVLLHSLVYRVEQVFLIHRQSGVLLQHVAAKGGTFQDVDLVSGMLTAIQDFVGDSFDVAADDELKSIQYGDFMLWVVRGPKAGIACAIRGNAPEGLRVVMSEALEKTHLEQGDALDAFEGDPEPFEPSRDHLESCLQARYQKKEKRFSWVLGLLLLVAIVLLSLWAFWAIRDHQRWADYLRQLKAEPGIVVTEALSEGGIYRVSGLRDPLAREPAAILAATQNDPGAVIHHFQPYQALSPGFVLARARRALMPPATLKMSFDDGVLKVEGAAPYAWVQDARKLAPSLPGVEQFDDTDLGVDIDLTPLDAPDSVSLEVQDGVLRASGSAPHRWMVAAKEKAPEIAGIDKYDDSGLQDTDLAALMSLKKQLERKVILFGFNAMDREDKKNRLDRVLTHIKRSIELAQAAGKRASIEVIGHSDSSGSPQHNLNLSQGRAESVRYYLVANGIKSEYISARGAGTAEGVKQERSEQDKRMNRSVTFKVWLTDRVSGLQ